MSQDGQIVCLTGGIGGAKLALGLYKTLPAGRLTIGVNTGDDFRHLGLEVWPDFDTTLYTLSGLSDQERGWGRQGETWAFMAALRALGGPDWFNLGDQDLATHVLRTQVLAGGGSPVEVAEQLTEAVGITARLLPATESPVRTMVETDEGVLEFQDYFVRRRAAPVVRRIRYDGADQAHASPALLEALAAPDLRGVIIAPSNPLLSIGPLLAVVGVKEALAACVAPVIAVSPIVHGAAIKGPTAKIMEELGIEVSATSVAKHYAGLIDGYVLDQQDQALSGQIEGLGLACKVAQTVMETEADKIGLARETLQFLDALGAQPKVAHGAI